MWEERKKSPMVSSPDSVTACCNFLHALVKITGGVYECLP